MLRACSRIRNTRVPFKEDFSNFLIFWSTLESREKKLYTMMVFRDGCLTHTAHSSSDGPDRLLWLAGHLYFKVRNSITCTFINFWYSFPPVWFYSTLYFYQFWTLWNGNQKYSALTILINKELSFLIDKAFEILWNSGKQTLYTLFTCNYFANHLENQLFARKVEICV